MSSHRHGMSVGIVVASLGVTLAAAVGIFAIVMAQRPAPGPAVVDRGPTRAELVEGMTIVEFEGTDHLGRPVDHGVFDEGWTVLSFGFTHCPLACPVMHGHQYRISSLFADKPVRFVTISVDPVHDTVERLAEYADKWNVADDRWLFVRVEPETLERLHEGLGLVMSKDDSLMINLPEGGEMANIMHSSRLILVGPGAEPVGLYRGMDADEVDELARDALALAAGG